MGAGNKKTAHRRGGAQTTTRRETRLVHGNHPSRGGPRGEPTLPPLELSTAFVHDSAETMEAVFTGRQAGVYYSRMQNPTVAALEGRVTDLCGAAGTLAMASGMSAITCLLLSLLKTGDELIAGPHLFGGSYGLFTRTLGDLGIRVRFADPQDVAAVAALVNDRTRAVFVEAIANPQMTVPDFAALRGLCQAEGLPLLVDATLLTPLYFNAEALGADVAVFSATKYLSGAASTTGGVVVDSGRFDWAGSARHGFGEMKGTAEGALMTKLRNQIMAVAGPSLSPLHAFLMLTGMESLALRMERMEANTQALAEFLAAQPAVSAVRYPGLPGHAAHGRCRALCGTNGTLLTFHLADKAACFALLNALRLVRRSTNLGDTRTLAIHPASTIYGTLWPHEQVEVGVDATMIRLSVGIEHIDDLREDLGQALAGL